MHIIPKAGLCIERKCPYMLIAYDTNWQSANIFKYEIAKVNLPHYNNLMHIVVILSGTTKICYSANFYNKHTIEMIYGVH